MIDSNFIWMWLVPSTETVTKDLFVIDLLFTCDLYFTIALNSLSTPMACWVLEYLNYIYVHYQLNTKSSWRNVLIYVYSCEWEWGSKTSVPQHTSMQGQRVWFTRDLYVQKHAPNLISPANKNIQSDSVDWGLGLWNMQNNMCCPFALINMQYYACICI